jgi:hypothetical protein
VARHRQSGELIGYFTRSCREAFIAGERRRLGYLGQLRLTPAWQARSRAILRGFQLCRELLADGHQDTPYFLTSILADNRRAQRMLAESSAGMPCYQPVAGYLTLVFAVCQRLGQPGFDLDTGRAENLEEVAELLLREGARKCFHPVWTAAELARLREVGLGAEDFLVARRQGKVVGCLALWDQRRLKQLRIAAYKPPLSALRPLINPILRAAAYPSLPPQGAVLRQAFLSHVAVAGDDEQAFRALLGAALAQAAGRGIDSLAMGFCKGHPLLAVAQKRLRSLVYRSRLYLIHWDEGRAEVERLAGLPMHAEAACL